MAIRSDEITSIIRSEIKGFDSGADVSGVGTIVEVGDGIAQVYGLSGALAQELLEFANGDHGHGAQPRGGHGRRVDPGRLHLASRRATRSRTTGRIVEVPVGDALIGRVVNALGEPIDGKGADRDRRSAARSSASPPVSSSSASPSTRRCRPASRRSTR